MGWSKEEQRVYRTSGEDAKLIDLTPCFSSSTMGYKQTVTPNILIFMFLVHGSMIDALSRVH